MCKRKKKYILKFHFLTQYKSDEKFSIFSQEKVNEFGQIHEPLKSLCEWIVRWMRILHGVD
jgi:hypothetical protein